MSLFNLTGKGTRKTIPFLTVTTRSAFAPFVGHQCPFLRSLSLDGIKEAHSYSRELTKRALLGALRIPKAHNSSLDWG